MYNNVKSSEHRRNNLLINIPINLLCSLISFDLHFDLIAIAITARNNAITISNKFMVISKKSSYN